MIHQLQHPFTNEQIHELQLGDTVYLSGEIAMSAGIPTYNRLVEYIKNNKDLPFNLNDGSLLHLGFNLKKTEGIDRVLYVNPTTSTRFNPYMPTLIRSLNLKVTGGKGGLNPECVKSMKEVGCVYLAFLGGGAPIYRSSIENIPEIYWSDFVPHYRLTRIIVNQLGPLTVAIDSHGNSLYEKVEYELESRYQGILKKLLI